MMSLIYINCPFDFQVTEELIERKRRALRPAQIDSGRFLIADHVSPVFFECVKVAVNGQDYNVRC